MQCGVLPTQDRLRQPILRHYPQKTQVCSAKMTHRLCRPQIPRQSGLILNLADLARANGSWCYSTAIWTPGARPFGSNGAISGARQALHAFGVDDVDHCSELCSESCSKSCSQCGSLYPSTNGSFFVSAEVHPHGAGYCVSRQNESPGQAGQRGRNVYESRGCSAYAANSKHRCHFGVRRESTGKANYKLDRQPRYDPLRCIRRHALCNHLISH